MMCSKARSNILHTIITRLRISSSICVFSFILSACRSNFAQVARSSAVSLYALRFLEEEDETFQVTRRSHSVTTFNWPESTATACGVYGHNSQLLVSCPQPQFYQKKPYSYHIKNIASLPPPFQRFFSIQVHLHLWMSC